MKRNQCHVRPGVFGNGLCLNETCLPAFRACLSESVAVMMIVLSACISAFAFVRSIVDIIATRRQKAKARFEAELTAQFKSVIAAKQDHFAQLRAARQARYARMV